MRIYIYVSRGFSKTGALSEAAWQVGLRGILESASTLFQVQQRFWALNFFTSLRNEEPEHSLDQFSSHPSGVLDLAQLLEKLYQRSAVGSDSDCQWCAVVLTRED